MSDVPLRPESIVVASGRPPREPAAPVTTPIVLSSTFHVAPGTASYLRTDGSDTIAALEDALGALDGGRATVFASGMAAIAAVFESRPAGTVMVVPTVAYWGTVSLLAQQAELRGVQLRQVEMTDTAAVVAALDGADVLWLETVNNPMLDVADLPALITAAKQRGLLVGVDATFSTPLTVRPLDLGADVVMHSTTKFLAGHSDLVGGVLITGSDELHATFRTRRAIGGAVPGGLEAYLALRGLRTLSVRWERASANAADLAARLAAHPEVTRVRYPGFGAMISFEVAGTVDDAERVCAALRLITHATSLGGVESLIERRARHAGDAAMGVPETLLRFSVGIEHVEDLWTDLTQALGSAG